MAAEIKPDMPEALSRWGYALVLLAEVQEGDNREVLLSEAVEKCTKAIEIEPDDYEALCNLCNALSMLAYNYKGRQRTETLEAALEKAKRVEDSNRGQVFTAWHVFLLCSGGKKMHSPL